MKLSIDYDEERDTVTIEGVKYSGDFFRALSLRGMPAGSLFTIERHELAGLMIRMIWNAEKEKA